MLDQTTMTADEFVGEKPPQKHMYSDEFINEGTQATTTPAATKTYQITTPWRYDRTGTERSLRIDTQDLTADEVAAMQPVPQGHMSADDFVNETSPQAAAPAQAVPATQLASPTAPVSQAAAPAQTVPAERLGLAMRAVTSMARGLEQFPVEKITNYANFGGGEGIDANIEKRMLEKYPSSPSTTPAVVDRAAKTLGDLLERNAQLGGGADASTSDKVVRLITDIGEKIPGASFLAGKISGVKSVQDQLNDAAGQLDAPTVAAMVQQAQNLEGPTKDTALKLIRSLPAYKQVSGEIVAEKSPTRQWFENQWELPASQSTSEKVADIAGGLAAFMIGNKVVGKVLPNVGPLKAGTGLRQAAQMELVTDYTSAGQAPIGEGSAVGEAYSLMAKAGQKVPGPAWVKAFATVAAAMLAGYGTTKVTGGDDKTAAIMAAFPAVLGILGAGKTLLGKIYPKATPEVIETAIEHAAKTATETTPQQSAETRMPTTETPNTPPAPEPTGSPTAASLAPAPPAPPALKGGLEPVPGAQDPQAVLADLLARKQAQEAAQPPQTQEPPRQAVENAPGSTPAENPPVRTPEGEIGPLKPEAQAVTVYRDVPSGGSSYGVGGGAAVAPAEPPGVHVVPKNTLTASLTPDGEVTIDKSIPRYYEPAPGVKVDVHQALAIHEKAEEVQLDQGKPYKDAHMDALKAEHDYVAAQGADPVAYTEWMQPYIDAAGSKSPEGNPPIDERQKPALTMKSPELLPEEEARAEKAPTAAPEPSGNTGQLAQTDLFGKPTGDLFAIPSKERLPTAAAKTAEPMSATDRIDAKIAKKFAKAKTMDLLPPADMTYGQRFDELKAMKLKPTGTADEQVARLAKGRERQTADAQRQAQAQADQQQAIIRDQAQAKAVAEVNAAAAPLRRQQSRAMKSVQAEIESYNKDRGYDPEQLKADLAAQDESSGMGQDEVGYTFRGPIPNSLDKAISQAKDAKRIREVIKGNVGGNTRGEELWGRIGDQEMIARAREIATGKDRAAEEIAAQHRAQARKMAIAEDNTPMLAKLDRYDALAASADELKPRRKYIISDETMESARRELEKFARGEALSGVIGGARQLALYAIRGAGHMERGIVKFSQWATKMIAEWKAMGGKVENIPNLGQLWNRIRTNYLDPKTGKPIHPEAPVLDFETKVKLGPTTPADKVWEARYRREQAKERIAEVEKSTGAPTAKETKAAVKAIVNPHAADEPIVTAKDALKYALKKTESASLSAYKEGQVQQVKTAQQLAKLAQLLPMEDKGRVMPAILKARTPAEIRDAATAIYQLADVSSRRHANEVLNKTIGGLDVRHMHSEVADPLKEIMRTIQSPQNAADRANSITKLIASISKSIRYADAETPTPAELKEAGRQSLIRDATDTDLLTAAKEAMLRAGDKPMRLVAPEDQITISNALKHVAHINETANKLFIEGKAQEIGEFTRGITDSLGKQKPLKSLNPFAKPTGDDLRANAANRFLKEGVKASPQLAELIDGKYGDLFQPGGNFHKVAVDDMRGNNAPLEDSPGGGNRQALAIKQDWVDGRNAILGEAGFGPKAGIKNVLKNRRTSKDLKDLQDTKKGPGLTFENGRTIQMSEAELMELAAHLTDPDTRRQLIDEKAPYALQRQEYTGRPLHLTEADAAMIDKALQPWQRKLIDWDIAYRNSEKPDGAKFDPKALSNQAWEQLEGYSKVLRERQFPRRRTQAQQQTQEPQTWQQWTRLIENEGIFKPRAEEDQSPIRGGDWFRTTERHIDLMSRFIGMAKPIRNFKMVLGDPDVKAGLVKVYGKQSLDHWSQYWKDVMGMRALAADLPTKVVGKMMGRAVSSVVRYRPTVWLKQIGRVFMSAAELGPEALPRFAAGLRPGAFADFKNWIQKYSPELRERYSRQTTAEFIPEYGTPSGLKQGWGFGNMTGTQKIDARTVMAGKDIIEAKAKKMFPDATPDEIGRITNDELMKVVGRTQNPISATDMPGMAREGRRSFLPRAIMTLSGEKTAIWNYMVRSIEQGRATGDWGKAAYKVAMGPVANAIWVAAVSTAASYGWGKMGTKKDKKEAWEYALDPVVDLFGGMPLVGSVIQTAKDAAVSIAKDQTPNLESPHSGIIAMQPIEHFYAAVADLSKAWVSSNKGKGPQVQKQALSALYEAAIGLMNLRGVPTAPTELGGKIYNKWIAPPEEPQPKARATSTSSPLQSLLKYPGAPKNPYSGPKDPFAKFRTNHGQ